MAESNSPKRLGIWLIGAGGGVATTVITGAKLLAHGLAPNIGCITETSACAKLEPAPLQGLVFGGHDIRRVRLVESAAAIAAENSSFTREQLDAVRDELLAVDLDVKSGSALNCGATIGAYADQETQAIDRLPLADIVARLGADIAAFRKKHALERMVVVNVGSTEPPLETTAEHLTAAGIGGLIAADRRHEVRASTLYAIAALESGCAFVNFTPSNAALLPGHLEMAERRGLPVMGSDGKTGETLVKTALAPLFKQRALRVLTWHGYNILGDRDGEVLADPANRSSKLATKDGVLESILGYRPDTRVGIEYARSLADMKTAWDFIHFEGFLGFRMNLQFTWQGCDSILAAPLILDLARFADIAMRRGERGLMSHLACFFKRPEGTSVHDLHRQYARLDDYIDGRS